MQKVATLIKDIPLGCKLLYVLSFVVYVVGLFSYNFSILMANLTYLTYANKQYWRLFSSVLSPGISLFSILSLIVDFCLIQFFFAKIVIFSLIEVKKIFHYIFLDRSHPSKFSYPDHIYNHFSNTYKNWHYQHVYFVRLWLGSNYHCVFI